MLWTVVAMATVTNANGSHRPRPTDGLNIGLMVAPSYLRPIPRLVSGFEQSQGSALSFCGNDLMIRQYVDIFESKKSEVKRLAFSRHFLSAVTQT